MLLIWQEDPWGNILHCLHAHFSLTAVPESWASTLFFRVLWKQWRHKHTSRTLTLDMLSLVTQTWQYRIPKQQQTGKYLMIFQFFLYVLHSILNSKNWPALTLLKVEFSKKTKTSGPGQGRVMTWLEPGSHLKHYCLAVRLRFVLHFLRIFIFLQKHSLPFTNFCWGNFPRSYIN